MHTRILTYIAFNLATLGTVFLVPFHPGLIGLAVASYYFRMFAVTGVLHRYFSHRSYEFRNRFWRFLFGLWSLTAVQRGPLWWASTHRHHHQHSDAPEDLHSPRHKGFWYAQAGWVFGMKQDPNYRPLPLADLRKYPEIVWLDRLDVLGPLLYGAILHGIGGWPWVVWGLGVSTVFLWHGTSTINSVAHVSGTQRYDTGDDSRNNPWLSGITCGEGWHNNHHFHPGSARQGWFPGEPDPTYGMIAGLHRLGIVSRIQPVPERVYEQAPPASIG